MKIGKKILLLLLILLVGIQFFHPEKNQTTAVPVNDIGKLYAIPDDVKIILAKACNDCHTNNTVYPWYNNIQPIAWWLNNHVVDGKRNFNFDEFATYRVAKQYKRMQQCINLVKKNEMPLDSYTWIHKNAILTDAEKETFFKWCNAVRDSIKAKYPADSLIIPNKKRS